MPLMVPYLPSSLLLWPGTGVGFHRGTRSPRLWGQALLGAQLLAQAPLLLLGHKQLQLQVALAALGFLGHLMQPFHVQALQLRQPQPLALL